MDRNRTFFPFGGQRDVTCTILFLLFAVLSLLLALQAALWERESLDAQLEGRTPETDSLSWGVPRGGGGGLFFSVWPGKSALRPCGGAAAAGLEALPRSSPSWRPCSLSRPGERYPSHRRYPPLEKSGTIYVEMVPLVFRFSASVRMLWPAPPALQSWAGFIGEEKAEGPHRHQRALVVGELRR